MTTSNLTPKSPLAVKHHHHHPKKVAAPQTTTPAERTGPASGANPKLAAAVKAIDIHKYDATPGTTYCNMAVNAYAKQLGYNGFEGKNANTMVAQMSKPGSGWHKATTEEAIAAAKKGELVVGGWSSKGHGHVVAVIGEYAPGVPAIAQAGGHTDKATGRTINNTFEYGPITQTRPNPTFFVRD
jgi:hypothetical protein